MNIRPILTIVLAASFSSLAFSAAKKSQNLEIIRAGLQDQDREIRVLSARALGDVGDKTSITALKELLTAPNGSDSLKIAAAVALSKLGDRSGISELRKILRNAPALSDNPTAVERARAVAKGSIRAQAARELGNLKDEGSKQILSAAADDDDGRVADASMIALAKLGDTAGIRQFVSALESTKQEVRAKAAEALGEIGGESAIVPIRKRLKDWDRNAKAAAALALGMLKDRESTPAIRELLWDKEDIVKEKAAQALGYMGNTEVTPSLRELLKDKNGFVRFAAVEALYKLGEDAGKEFLLTALKSDETDAKLKALSILERVAGAKDIPAIEPLVSESDRRISINAAKAILMAESREKTK